MTETRRYGLGYARSFRRSHSCSTALAIVIIAAAADLFPCRSALAAARWSSQMTATPSRRSRPAWSGSLRDYRGACSRGTKMIASHKPAAASCFNLAGDLPAAFDLDFAIGNLAGNPTRGADQRFATGRGIVCWAEDRPRNKGSGAPIGIWPLGRKADRGTGAL